ncbi:hypothetical protein [Amycolatopsis sp. lyj-108]|uniref:hypothetical protein n=1 Tax=Amycolatopsis sp. lyj-108 TaxID=2789286 RepID=UPI00397A9CF3
MPLKLAAVVAACCALLGGFLVAAPAAAVGIRCSGPDLPVTGPLGEPATAHGRFCLPEGPAPKAVQPLVYGGTPFEKVAGGKLGSVGSDPLYFTTKPGARAGLFHATENTDPRVIEADEVTKDQVAVPGMGTVAVFGIVLPATKAIEVPVFQAVGEKDILFCGLFALRDCSNARTLRPAEAPFYRPEAELSTYVLSGAGHSLALHRNASQYRDATRVWLREKVGIAVP